MNKTTEIIKSTLEVQGNPSLIKIPSKWISRAPFCLCVCFVAFGVSSCAGLARDMGMDHPSDLQQRTGITGTIANPAPLDPFITYDLVMAGNECRFFTMVVPSKWFWKVYLTVANREDSRRGELTAMIQQISPPWGVLPNIGISKDFDLGREGLQAILGVGNPGEDRVALFRLCQEGAPVHITISSQISATRALMGPGDLQTPVPWGD